MGLLVACKNADNPIKNEGARVVTTSFIKVSDAQGQLTPKSVMESCRYSNSCGFEPHRRHCIVVLEQDTFILA